MISLAQLVGLGSNNNNGQSGDMLSPLAQLAGLSGANISGQSGDMMTPMTQVPQTGTAGLLQQFQQQADAARAANEQRYNQALGISRGIEQMYQPGGSLEQAAMQQYNRGKQQSMAQGMQNLVGSGLAGTTLAGTLGTKYEEQVGTPFRLQLAAQQQQQLADAKMQTEGIIERRQDVSPDPALMAQLATQAESGPTDSVDGSSEYYNGGGVGYSAAGSGVGYGAAGGGISLEQYNTEQQRLNKYKQATSKVDSLTKQVDNLNRQLEKAAGNEQRTASINKRLSVKESALKQAQSDSSKYEKGKISPTQFEAYRQYLQKKKQAAADRARKNTGVAHGAITSGGTRRALANSLMTSSGI